MLDLLRPKIRSNHYDYMQKAVEAVSGSAHPSSKVSSLVVPVDCPPDQLPEAQTNYWPESIRDNFPPDARIGNASGTVHSETESLLMAGKTDDASIYVTDPFCPNCAKNLVEAGIKHAYIDHKGFEKDYLVRRREFFENMSLNICRKGGINVYKLWRKAKKIEPLVEIDPDYLPVSQRPVEIIRFFDGFEDVMREQQRKYADISFASALCADPSNGEHLILTAANQPVTGYTFQQDADIISSPEGKYTLWTEPVNRLLMQVRKHGLILDKETVFSSRVPTSREQVNMVGAGIKRLYIGDPDLARDDDSFKAMEMLHGKRIVSYTSF